MSKRLLKTIGLGIASSAIYAAVFGNLNFVMKYFTKGGVFASLPIITVFAVSFVYGTFASNLWSLLGIEATRPVVQPRATLRRRVQRERVRPRLSIELPYNAKGQNR